MPPAKRSLRVEQIPPTGLAAKSRHPPPEFAAAVSIEALEAITASVTLHPASRDAHFSNWAGVFHSDAPTHNGAFGHTVRCIFAPNTIEQVVAIIELARRGGSERTLPIPVRAVGKLHSPSDLPFSLGWSIRMDELQGVLSIDTEKMCAKVLGGTYLHTINTALAAHEPPLAMHNLGSISEQTIAGVISTATHGSGIHFPVISADVLELELVCPLSEGTKLVSCSRADRPDLFNATLCGLGATGVIVSVTISVEHAFRLCQVKEDVPLSTLLGPVPPPIAQLPELLAREPYDAFAQNPAAFGILLAAGVPLPPAPVYAPPPRSAAARDIFPFVPLESIPQQGPLWNDCHATRIVQERIEQLVYSAEHVRFLIFPSAEMVTIDRASRTNLPAEPEGMLHALYQRLVGYHLTQMLLFASRFHPSFPRNIARTVYRLTHPTPPSEPNVVTSDPAPLSTASAVQVRVDDGPRVFNFDCLFAQYTYEYAIPFECTAAALLAIRTWLDEEFQCPDGVRPHFPVEIRFVDADGIWLSHCYGYKTCFIGIVQYRPYNLPVPYRTFFSRFESLMRQFNGRPHWAKTHGSYRAELLHRYPHLPDWLHVQAEYDPERMFVNPYVARHLMDEHGASRTSLFKKSYL
ncbi:hypothetical protein MVES1_003209 [Malassezia vespertilionis]|uniref:D-arabinono-1,4-lactone oxidase n=1 Tax=Malassezia vespertilionis TaxID=2020962 RepID=A0A2N1J8Z3_9BASI|nr:uncharacterized protein MVES1_003209 [Malassezia vespertilionis]PKI83025.1 Alo1p [Malassezia vespertilionis]WFD07841.1 hypothetical protein MVES1_003209 [Malassezia vespertilionis]